MRGLGASPAAAPPLLLGPLSTTTRGLIATAAGAPHAAALPCPCCAALLLPVLPITGCRLPCPACTATSSIAAGCTLPGAASAAAAAAAACSAAVVGVGCGVLEGVTSGVKCS